MAKIPAVVRRSSVIAASVRYVVTWSALVGGAWLGPYPMGTVERAAAPLVYPVEQAEPEIIAMGA